MPINPNQHGRDAHATPPYQLTPNQKFISGQFLSMRIWRLFGIQNSRQSAKAPKNESIILRAFFAPWRLGVSLLENSGGLWSSLPGAAWKISRGWWRGNRRLTQLSLLQIIATSLRNGLPLPEMLHAFALEHRNIAKEEIRSFAKTLEKRISLPTAAEQQFGLFDDRAILTLHYGTQTGTLPEVLEELIQTEREELDSLRYSPPQSRAYWIVLSLIALGAFCYLNLTITPRFSEIIKEFGMQDPPFYSWYVEVSNTLFQFFPVFLIAGVIFIAWVLNPRFSRAFRSLYPWKHESDQGNRAYPSTYGLLANSVEQEKPLVQSLSALAKYYPTSGVRHQLLVARNDIELGAKPWLALVDTGLLTQEEGRVIESSPSSDFQAYVLRNIANRQRIRQESSTKVKRIFLDPALTLFFGLLVLLVTAAYFSVLTSFITLLS